jgi:hypothetical protein
MQFDRCPRLDPERADVIRRRVGVRALRKSRSWWKAASTLTLGLMLVVPVRAEEPARDHQPWLRQWFPELQQGIEELPPFFRDTKLNLHLRTYYFNETNSDGSAQEALATGGWLDYQSGWLLDTVAVGGVGYLSEPLYAPSDRDGTLLLEPGQRGYAVLGQAWAAVRYEDYALLKGPRQLVDQGYVNPYDSRMTPNTFEGVTLSGKAGPVEYYGGYLARMKPRNENEFSWMTEIAGVIRHTNGLGVASVRVTPWKELSVYAAEYYLPDTYNTAFGQITYAHPLTAEVGLAFGFQYTDQRSVGAQFLGNFVTWNVSSRAQLSYAGATLTTALSFTGMANDLQTPFGRFPGYLKLQINNFDQANQNVWGVGLAYDLERLGLRGLSATTRYAQGTNAVKPFTSEPVSNLREGNFRLDYVAPARVLQGFTFSFQGAVASTGAPRLENQFRIVVNYDLSLF